MKEFTREGVLDAVTKFVAVDNQSLAVADNVPFRNSLVSMRPHSSKSDLPSTHDVTVYLHNSFSKTLQSLREEINVNLSFSL
ncbi:hypothetical protein BDN72DRAFT_774510 [Pluteus cervinus]|uniref:Uncharacterized protein n=1 Tax=Pluteus cervinus TaxID=181527 RepID=A0ACD3AF04_9AGAR|nr:hypothetical protein BDN72DRAFT_774510 [Pluteus cervinus]